MLLRTLSESPSTPAISPSAYDEVFGNDADFARRIAGNEPLTLDRMEAAIAGASTENAELIRSMFERAQVALRGPAGVGRLGAVSAAADLEEAEKKQAFMAAMNDYVIGQGEAKEILWQIILARQANILDDTPTVIAFPGPPGVGKTEMTRALAAYFHNDPEKVAKIEGGGIQDIAALRTHFGTPGGFVGHALPDPNLELGNTKLQAMFGDTRPLVVLVDEIDKIGSDKDPEVWKKFEDMMTGAFDHGVLTLQNGEKVDMKDCIFVMTSNAGADDADGLERGPSLRRHYKRALEGNLKGHIYSRVDNIVPFDPLLPSEREEIVDLNLGKLFKKASAKLAGKGVEVSLRADPEVRAYLAELSASRSGGARELKKIIKNLVQPLVAKGLGTAQDEEKYELRFKRDSTALERDGLVKAFRDNGGKITSDAARRLGLELVCTAKRPKFQAYGGNLPYREPLHVWGSAVVNMSSFVCAYDGNETKLQQLVFGATDADHELSDIDGLPDAIKQANLEVQMAPLDEHRLLLRSVNCPMDSKMPEQSLVVFDTRTQEFSIEEPPPVAMYGGSLVTVGGHAFLAGGRVPRRKGDEWQVVVDPSQKLGQPSADQIFHRTPAGKWSALPGRLSVPRSAMAATTSGNTAYLCGGETIFRTISGVAGTKSSDAVDIIRVDGDKVTISSGPKLRHATAYGSACADQETGVVTVMGGADFQDSGSKKAFTSAVQRLRTSQAAPDWKSSAADALPSASYRPAIIAIPDGFAVGPLVNTDVPFVAWR